MIRARGISKICGGAQVLADVDLALDAGRALALVGTNGSGRSTLLQILATLVRPTSGQLEVDGIDALGRPFEARARMAFVPQSVVFSGNATVGEFLEFAAGGRDSAPETEGTRDARRQLCDGVDVRAPVRTLSRGTRQKVALAASLLRGPRVLLLDEPLNHLDPIASTRLQDLVQAFRTSGGTVVVACNRMADVEALCDEVAFMHRGRVLERRWLADLHGDLGGVLEGLVGRAAAAGRRAERAT